MTASPASGCSSTWPTATATRPRPRRWSPCWPPTPTSTTTSAATFPHFPGARDLFADDAAREQAAKFNATLQVGYFLLGVRAAGLAAGPMGGFDADGIDEEFFAGRHLKSLLRREHRPARRERLVRPAAPARARRGRRHRLIRRPRAARRWSASEARLETTPQRTAKEWSKQVPERRPETPS